MFYEITLPPFELNIIIADFFTLYLKVPVMIFDFC